MAASCMSQMRADAICARTLSPPGLDPVPRARWRPSCRGSAAFRAAPDGVLLDHEGRVYLAGPGGIWVLDRNGGRLGVIATPETPSACAFGDADGRTLYITAQTSIYKVRLSAAVR